MAELTPREKLQPSLLDRLMDDERGLDFRVTTERARLFELLNKNERKAFDALFDIERRDGARLTKSDLQPFDRLDEKTIEQLQHVVTIEQQLRFEVRNKRVMSLEKLKQSVFRDISWLLNTECAEAVVDFDSYQRARDSVVNYGIPTITGLTLSDLDDRSREGLAARIRNALVAFEPRLDPDTIVVVLKADRELLNRRALSFEIEATLIAEPAPLRLSFVSVVDLETGDAELHERAA